MFFVGLLFGLGFDTATEIALLVLSGSSAASGLPWYAILCLPILFAAGMSLLDTAEGFFMSSAYGWALATPARKIHYNLVVTGLSVVVAVVVGTTQIVVFLGETLNLHGVVWDVFTIVDLNTVGFIIVGLFIAIWGIAILFRKRGWLDERWTVGTSSLKTNRNIRSAPTP
jgi:high-affinity nickel-transport protein